MNGQVSRWVLSGGIGCGKSTVRRLLEDYGFLGIDADSVGHEVLEAAGPAYEEVSQRWPEVVVDGNIDRGALGRIVFDNSEQLNELEAITHPHIFGTILTHLKDWDGSVVVEIPLLEHGLGEGWKRLIVDCDDGVRLTRLVERGMAPNEAVSRMDAQPRRDEWLAVADLVIPNRDELEDLFLSVAAFVDTIAR